jgi:hypothetical protein
MIRRFLPGLLVALAVAACSSTRPTSPTLAGKWAPLSAELGGQAFPVATFGEATLRLTRLAEHAARQAGSAAGPTRRR